MSARRPIQFCPYCGTPVERRPIFGKLRAVCPACDWKHFEDPKVAVTALVIRAGQVLLTRRANQPQHGKWSLPGGFMDAREDPQRAVERECLEETGLRVKASGLITLLSGREHPHGADLLLVYRAEIIDGELKAGDDASEACFFMPPYPPLAFKSTAVILAGLAQPAED